MSTGTGLNVSKVNAYAVLWSNTGLSVSKTNAYAVLGAPPATPPSWPSFSFVDGQRTVPYSQQFTPNGTAPITVTLTSGALPTGLSLSLVSGSTYKIAGTPTVSGTFTFTLTATNSFGGSGQNFSILVNPLLPAWPAFSFVDGLVGIAYSQTFTPTGSPTSVTVLSGSLPPGLSLSLVSGSTYKVAGTPTTAGSYSFTLRATNADGNADQAFSITINSVGGSSYCFVA